MLTPKIGLLPFYIKLYDEAMPELRTRLEPFVLTIADALTEFGIEVISARPCCVHDEFQAAVQLFEEQQADAIVTLHLAYSPSLESADVLAAAHLPVIVLDTTPAEAFGPDQKAEEILSNHGIHGVQDLCNLLIRRGKPFVIEAGHWQGDVLERIRKHAMAAAMRNAFRNLRIGLLGQPFPGMGDFTVPEDSIRDDLGFSVIQGHFAQIKTIIEQLEESDILAEIVQNKMDYSQKSCSDHTLRQAVVAGLALRRWLTDEQLAGFSINFMDVDKQSHFTAMPFLEISQAMARGTGYAGEGDVLTASLMSILATATPDVSFVEMFCPDWRNGSLFLSHMGEANIDLMAGRPVLSDIAFKYTDVGPTVAAFGAFRPGSATLVNLAPVGDGLFRLILSPGTMLKAQNDDDLRFSIRGWFKPQLPLEKYLADYSRLGGTHHSVVVYDADLHLIQLFGEAMGWQVKLLAQA
jgi:L-arabinose isomerase